MFDDIVGILWEYDGILLIFHEIMVHYTTLRCTTLHFYTTILHYTTLRYDKLHYTYYSTLH